MMKRALLTLVVLAGCAAVQPLDDRPCARNARAGFIIAERLGHDAHFVWGDCDGHLHAWLEIDGKRFDPTISQAVMLQAWRDYRLGRGGIGLTTRQGERRYKELGRTQNLFQINAMCGE